MQAVLNAPMGSYGVQDAPTVSRERTDDETFLGCHSAGDLSRRFDASDTGDLRPTRFQARQFKQVQFADREAATGFYPAMTLVQRSVQRPQTPLRPR